MLVFQFRFYFCQHTKQQQQKEQKMRICSQSANSCVHLRREFFSLFYLIAKSIFRYFVHFCTVSIAISIIYPSEKCSIDNALLNIYFENPFYSLYIARLSVNYVRTFAKCKFIISYLHKYYRICFIVYSLVCVYDIMLDFESIYEFFFL